MSGKSERFDIISCLVGAGLYVVCVCLGGVAGTVLYALVEGLAEEVRSLRAAVWISMGVGGFFAGFVAGYVGGWGTAFLHKVLLKNRSMFSAVIGGLVVSALVVAITLFATLTDPEMPFGWNTVGLVIGLPLGTFFGGMKVVSKSETQETLEQETADAAPRPGAPGAEG